jgi:hypothetical protein
MNKTLQELHDMLLARHTEMSQTLDGITDPAKAKTIIMEMQETLHRIDLVQNLLFRQSSQQLDATLAGITWANDALEKSIQSIEDIGAFLTATANFLKYEDEAIDIAKSLAV